MNKLISIYPEYELTIPVNPNSDTKFEFTLTNNTNQLVAFKIKTSAPKKRYGVRPAQGVLSPNTENFKIEIILIGSNNLHNDLNFPIYDKFLIQSIICNDDIYTQDVSALSSLWKTSENSLESHNLIEKDIRIAKLVSPSTTSNNNKQFNNQYQSGSSIGRNINNINDLVDSIIASHDPSNSNVNSQQNSESVMSKNVAEIEHIDKESNNNATDNIIKSPNPQFTHFSSTSNIQEDSHISNANAVNINATSSEEPTFNEEKNTEIRKPNTNADIETDIKVLPIEKYNEIVKKSEEYDKLINHTIELSKSHCTQLDIQDAQDKEIKELKRIIDTLNENIKSLTQKANVNTALSEHINTNNPNTNTSNTSKTSYIREGFKLYQIIVVAILCILLGRLI